MENNHQNYNDLEISLFERHCAYYSNIGIETIKQQAGQVEQVGSDYQGRVIYELLQNAFDKANKNILVQVKGQSLYIANDGAKFNYTLKYDYANGTTIRGDFQSLCSISTSTKLTSTSIGNKGVGFKSAFSVAHDKYVNIYTEGEILESDNKLPQRISFRVYDVFQTENDIPPGLSVFEATIKEKLKQVQQERPDRGIPGYYFPMHITHEPEFIQNLFKLGYVTIIEIPFKSKEEIEKLLCEIETIHFQFVGLKHKREFVVEFIVDDKLTLKRTINNSLNTLFTAQLNPDVINPLVEQAGLQVENAQVAIKFKENPNGLFYNYMPTRKQSPFKYVDFHADFHTTVDRKDINFDGEKVGAYNRALFNACVELYFCVLASYIPNFDYTNLKTKYITASSNQLNNFKWLYLSVGQRDAFRIVRDILKFDDQSINQWNYNDNKRFHHASYFLSELAYVYFETEREREEHENFFTEMISFINSFTDDYRTQYSRSQIFKEELFNKIKVRNARIIPNIEFDKIDEILFRKENNRSILLPKFLNVTLTDFEIADKTIKQTIGIQDFNDPNEILKYFRQCSFSGEYSTERITEEEQVEVLNICYRLYLTKRESNFLSTHRYSKAFDTRLREANSTLNQANFSISTLFLKLSNGKYKPAQLCSKSELDRTFYSSFIETQFEDDWLRFMGVSTESEYKFVDIEIYNSLKSGINIIPCLLAKNIIKDRITSSLIGNIRVINSRENIIHPALINDNNYSFFWNISNYKVKPELDNLRVKDYHNFPKEFLEVLSDQINEVLQTRFSEIVRFYQSVFRCYAKSKEYLIVQNNSLHWNNSMDFYILSNKADFDFCIKKFNKKKILAYYKEGIDELIGKIILPQKGEITFDDKVPFNEINERLNDKIQFILVNLHYSKNSKVKYLDEDTDLSELQNRFERMKVFGCTGLKQELIYGEMGSDSSPKAYAYNDTELFFSTECTISQKAQGICDFLFRNISIKEEVELILFHKETNELGHEYDHAELEIVNRKWKSDYMEKFSKFQQDILSAFNYSEGDDRYWFIYNEEHRNKFLIRIENENRLNELTQRIDVLKNSTNYEGYFDSFKLEIDRSHIFSKCSELILQLESKKEELTGEHIVRILSLKDRLGTEIEILEIEKDIKELFPGTANQINSTQLQTKTEELEALKKIEDIYALLNTTIVNKEFECLNFDGEAQSSQIKHIPGKRIFQFNGDGFQNDQEQAQTGANGEEEVLIFLIGEFIKMTVDLRKNAIQEINSLMQEMLRNNSYNRYACECLVNVEDNERLQQALIPFLYVTLHYKYSYFDLIAWRNNQPTLIEVKTTKNNKNTKFYLSSAEINAARGKTSYEIVRVSPTAITFMGNPIKQVEDKIEQIIGDNFSLKPRDYEFIYNN